MCKQSQGWILGKAELFLKPYADKSTTANRKRTNQIPMRRIEILSEDSSLTTNKKPNDNAGGVLEALPLAKSSAEPFAYK